MFSGLGFRVQGLGCTVWDRSLGFRFRAQGSGTEWVRIALVLNTGMKLSGLGRLQVLLFVLSAPVDGQSLVDPLPLSVSDP